MSLDVLVRLVLAQQLGLVGGLVGLQVLSVLSDVGPGPHVTDASHLDLHDAVEGVPPPSRENKHTPKPSNRHFHVMLKLKCLMMSSGNM